MSALVETTEGEWKLIYYTEWYASFIASNLTVQEISSVDEEIDSAINEIHEG
jgi:hypothetical protein